MSFDQFILKKQYENVKGLGDQQRAGIEPDHGVIQRDNFTRLEEMYRFAKEMRFDSITYQPVNDDNLDIRAVRSENPLRVPPEGLAELDSQIDLLIALHAQGGGAGGAAIGNTVRYLQGVKRHFRGERSTLSGRSAAVTCYAGYVTAIVSPDSKLWSCMGNVADLRKLSLEEAWSSPEAAEKRRLMRRCRTPCLYPCYLEGDADSLFGVLRNTLL